MDIFMKIKMTIFTQDMDLNQGVSSYNIGFEKGNKCVMPVNER